MAFKSDRRLYLTGDKSRVVEEGDKDAGFLFAKAGGQITEVDASAFGLESVGGQVILPAGRSEESQGVEPPASEPKAAKKSEDKSRKRGGDKAGPPPDKA